MSKKHKKFCRVLNHIDHLLTYLQLLDVFPLLVGIPMGISSFSIGLRMFAITAKIKKFMPIIKKRDDKIVLVAKPKLNSIEVLISKALINSNIIHDEKVLINNMLKEFYDMKEEIKNSNNKYKFKLYIKQCYLIV